MLHNHESGGRKRKEEEDEGFYGGSTNLPCLCVFICFKLIYNLGMLFSIFGKLVGSVGEC